MPSIKQLCYGAIDKGIMPDQQTIMPNQQTIMPNQQTIMPKQQRIMPNLLPSNSQATRKQVLEQNTA